MSICTSYTTGFCVVISKMGIMVFNADSILSQSGDSGFISPPFLFTLINSLFPVGYQPSATSRTVHHMLVFTCSAPGKLGEPYNCLGNSAICQEESTIIFAWGRDAQGMQLPEGMRMCVLRSCSVLPHCAVLPANILDASLSLRG